MKGLLLVVEQRLGSRSDSLAVVVLNLGVRSRDEVSGAVNAPTAAAEAARIHVIVQPAMSEGKPSTAPMKPEVFLRFIQCILSNQRSLR